ncbi:hypothetical protein TNCV_1404121 [Trichonephila clavipes]|nr:hypothetical protein TNCV_1404121 [Trichonephila clavipes]
MGASKNVISLLKKVTEGGNALRKNVGGSGRNTRESICSSRGKKEQKFHSWTDSCKPCNHYRYACFSKNHLTAVKSSWSMYTGACSLHPISTIPSSREITLA